MISNHVEACRKLGEILVEKLGVPRNIVEEGLTYQETLEERSRALGKLQTNTRSLGDILINTGLVSRDKVYRGLAIQKGVEFMPASILKGVVNYKLYRSPEILTAMNIKIEDLINMINQTHAFPSHYEKDEESEEKVIVFVATDVEKMARLEQLLIPLKRSNTRYKIVMSDNSMFDDFLLKYRAITKEELEVFADNIDKPHPQTREMITLEMFLQYLLCFAILEKASDIHVFPSSDSLAKISLRKFGVLETLFYMKYTDYVKLITMVKQKTEGAMKENNIHKPQDGRIDGTKLLKNVVINLKRPDAVVSSIYGINENELKYDFSKVSFRISSYPTEPNVSNLNTTFEKLVIRVLNLSAGLTELSDLGLSDQSVSELNRIRNRAQGIVLIVGPTGSGKSTTLYSLMSSINALEKSIITFEDPVEMRQLYWAQGQRKVVEDNSENTFDFNDAIKAILRQDPDIIMMAEIRDEETAKFTVTAANTGHLVFTTLHSNTAASAIERLKKLGADVQDIANSTLCIMSQRLVKKLCPHCRIMTPLSETQKDNLLRLEAREEIINSDRKYYVRNKNGCDFCNHLGYVGVVAINEIIPFTKEIRTLVEKGGSETDIRELATQKGFLPILEDGLQKSIEGICSIDDVIDRL